MSISLSAARAAASRRNGAKSRGPKTPAGKARSSRNALKHGLCAHKLILLDDEDARAFAALSGALADDLAPEGALQGVLARRLAVAAWRLERADRIENELFAIQGEAPMRGWGRLGLALVRDGNGSRAFDTLLRYRGSAMAELMRSLRALKALQAEEAGAARAVDAESALPDEPEARRKPRLTEHDDRQPERDLPQQHQPAPAPQARDPQGPDLQADAGADSEVVPAAPSARHERPIEPEARANPGEVAPAPPADEPQAGRAGKACPARGSVPCGHGCGRTHGATQACAIPAPPMRRHRQAAHDQEAPEMSAGTAARASA